MKNFIPAVSVLLHCMLITVTSAQSWQIVWSDEFDVDGLPDPSKWNYETGYVRNDEAQYYTNARSENARVESGELIIEARRDYWDGHEYTSASLITRGKAAWTYGRIEVRAKLPTGLGMWPAIWTLGTNIGEVGWPDCGEIDIMENVGFDPDRIHGNIHVHDYNHVLGTGRGSSILVTEPYNNYYTYAIEWFEDKLDFFVDDTRYFTFENEGTGWEVWPFDNDQYLILNIAVGGSWGGQQGVDESIFPQKMHVDYVRVYQRSYPGPYTLVTSVSGNGTIQRTPDNAQYDSGATVVVTAVPDENHEFLGWVGDISSAENPLTIAMTRNCDITARFALPGELVVNGGFDGTTNGWNDFYPNTATGIVASGVLDDTAFCVTVTQPGQNYWDAQLIQTGIPVEQSGNYRFSFDAWTQSGTTAIVAGVNESIDPWTNYFNETVSLSSTPRHFSYNFTMASPSDDNARVEFNYGVSSGTICVDNASLIFLDEVSSLRSKPALRIRSQTAPYRIIRLSRSRGQANLSLPASRIRACTIRGETIRLSPFQTGMPDRPAPNGVLIVIPAKE